MHGRKVQGKHSIRLKGNIIQPAMCKIAQPAKLKTGSQQSLQAVVQRGCIGPGKGYGRRPGGGGQAGVS